MKTKYEPFTSGNYHALISAEQSALVVIDHQTAFESCFDAGSVELAGRGIANLIDLAGKFDVPVITSFVESNLISSQPSSFLEKTNLQSMRFSRNSLNPWDDPEFVKAVQVANRRCLLITGLSVETSLSFTVLHALAMGFDVFVIKDTCLGYSEQSIDISFERLVQAGAVPVSWRQVMLEWQHKSVDVGLLRRVLKSRRLPRS